MKLPEPVRAEVEEALGEEIARVSGLGGGCISPAARLETVGGDRAFLKWSDEASPAGGFPVEARSLEALSAPDALRVPAVLGVSERWLLLEWLEPGRPDEPGWRRLGRGLAALHRVRAPQPGWPEDNYIGPLPQANAALADWPAFWRERRLAPQIRLACDGGFFGAPERRRLDALLTSVEELLSGAGADGASLLHGDLWSGNVLFTAAGEPALIDPASYHGHREVDLAMSRLFGGFDPGFYDAYDEAWPVPREITDGRRPVYQLYYLLVHVNVFGSGYVGSTLATLSAAGF